MVIIILKFKTIGDCGELGFEFSLKDGDGARISKKFLQSLILNIIKRSKKYFDETNGCHIFYWHEKELHSVVCPSIADLTFSYVIEHPITRKPRGKEEYSGKCDYWINYNNYSFVIELKHSYFAYKRNPSKIISERFNKCLNQLDEIKTQEARNMLT